MSAIDDACDAFARQLQEPWKDNLAGPERVWMVVYRPDSERRLRYRLPMFETAALSAGRSWQIIDIADSFEVWLAQHEYAEEYCRDPESLSYGALDGYVDWLARHIRTQLENSDSTTVTALMGAAGLFGLVRLSLVMSEVSRDIRGRLLVFFPGTREENNYRLLDGYDGWNYLAVPIN